MYMRNRQKHLNIINHICAGLQPCTKDGFVQIPTFTGNWVNSTDVNFNGFYTMSTDCPSWARDFDCKNPTLTGETLS